MSGIYIPHDKIPTMCMGCSFCDPEYGGNCVLMPSFDAETYEEQFERCPFKEISRWFGTAPEHGRLKDYDSIYAEYKRWFDNAEYRNYESMFFALWNAFNHARIIIPSDR